MNKKNLLTITLIISGLALNPVWGESVIENISHTQNTQQSVRTGISNVLFSKGLDEDAASEISENFVDESDEMLLATLIHNLENQNIVTREEVLEYLSSAALHKQKLDFRSYDTLIGMVAQIQKQLPDNTTRNQLSQIAKINKQLFV